MERTYQRQALGYILCYWSVKLEKLEDSIYARQSSSISFGTLFNHCRWPMSLAKISSIDSFCRLVAWKQLKINKFWDYSCLIEITLPRWYIRITQKMLYDIHRDHNFFYLKDYLKPLKTEVREDVNLKLRCQHSRLLLIRGNSPLVLMNMDGLKGSSYRCPQYGVQSHPPHHLIPLKYLLALWNFL